MKKTVPQNQGHGVTSRFQRCQSFAVVNRVSYCIASYDEMAILLHDLLLSYQDNLPDTPENVKQFEKISSLLRQFHEQNGNLSEDELCNKFQAIRREFLSLLSTEEAAAVSAKIMNVDETDDTSVRSRFSVAESFLRQASCVDLCMKDGLTRRSTVLSSVEVTGRLVFDPTRLDVVATDDRQNSPIKEQSRFPGPLPTENNQSPRTLRQ